MFFNDTATTEVYTLSLHDRSSDLTGGKVIYLPPSIGQHFKCGRISRFALLPVRTTSWHGALFSNLGWVRAIPTMSLRVFNLSHIEEGGFFTRPSISLTLSVNSSVSSDRKSFVYGKSVDLGGRRIIKKKKSL